MHNFREMYETCLCTINCNAVCLLSSIRILIQDDYEDTALHYAIENFKNDSVAALVELDSVDLRVKNKHDFPALHLACLEGNARYRLALFKTAFRLSHADPSPTPHPLSLSNSSSSSLSLSLSPSLSRSLSGSLSLSLPLYLSLCLCLSLSLFKCSLFERLWKHSLYSPVDKFVFL